VKGEDRIALEAQGLLFHSPQVLSDLADEALERQLADEQVPRLLILADLAQSSITRPFSCD